VASLQTRAFTLLLWLVPSKVWASGRDTFTIDSGTVVGTTRLSRQPAAANSRGTVFQSLAAARENQHLQIHELARREFVAGWITLSTTSSLPPEFTPFRQASGY